LKGRDYLGAGIIDWNVKKDKMVGQEISIT
jgi:hypothetical protein